MKGLINIKNTEDDKFFIWCLIRLLNPQKKDGSRIKKSDLELAKTLEFTDINIPLKAIDHEKVEKRFNINVNIIGYANKKVFPLFTSKKNNEQVLNVLLITGGDKSHYVYIKDISRLLASQLKTKNNHKKHICLHCLQTFTSEYILNRHKKICLEINGTQATKYEKGDIKFTNFNHLEPIPFRIYADIECFTKKITKKRGKHSKLYQENIPNYIAAKLY